MVRLETGHDLNLKLTENSLVNWKMEPLYRCSQYGSGRQGNRKSQVEFHTK